MPEKHEVHLRDGFGQPAGGLVPAVEQQQKVLLARNLMKTMDILILDEPTRGIDVGAKQEIYTIMNSLVATGVSIIMVSSELPEVLGMCDRILVMCRGEITGEFDNSRKDVTPERIMICATGAGSED